MAAEESPSRRTLEEAPGRVLQFLIGVGKSPVIRAILYAHGYDAEQHAYAWSLLAKLTAYGPAHDPAIVDAAVRNAVIELDAWDEPNFARIKAALDRLHPEQSQFVFHGLAASQGPQAVLGIRLFLDRMDALEKSPERKATRKADHAALDTLSKRGFTNEERQRLAGLVQMATTVVVAEPATDNERSAILGELYNFITDWGTTAKVTLKRRDHQIQVGIAQRKKPKKKGSSEEKNAAPPTKDASPATGQISPFNDGTASP
jgi:hypothetical protein